MGKFLNGLFIGVGVGLLIAPQNGEETRRLIMERVASLRNSVLPESDQHFSLDTRAPQITAFPVQPAQPLVKPVIQPLAEKTTSTSTFSSQATPEDQYAENVDNLLDSENIIKDEVPTTNTRSAANLNADQPSSVETSGGDSENTAKLPTLPNRLNTLGQSGNRKTSSGTSNGNKNRGNGNRS